MIVTLRTAYKWPGEAPGGNSDTSQGMNGTIEADVDAQATACRCCGQELTSKDSGRLCSKCVAAGCDADSSVCQRSLEVV